MPRVSLEVSWEKGSDDEFELVTATSSKDAQQLPIAPKSSARARGLALSKATNGYANSIARASDTPLPADTPTPAASSAKKPERDLRLYLVTQNDHNEDLLGLHVGSGSAAWYQLERQLRGGRLAGSGARLRRFKTVKEAQQAWKEAFPDQEMPVHHLP